MLKSKNDKLKEKTGCSQCGKRVRPKSETNGATGWILNLGTCKCDAIKDSPTNNSEFQTQTAKAETVEPDPIPTEIDGLFEVLSVLGKGGMGTVYKVRNTATDAVLALKLIHSSLSKDAAAVKRFEHEAQAVAQLDHPNLVAVYGHGKTKSGESYLIMDFVEGESLARVIEREGALDEQRAIEVFSQICAALSYAHEQNLVHRDLKPANIILAKTDDGEEIAKVVDFGIAKTLPSDDRETRDLTQTGEVFGSPHYMSPEQCLGFMLDQRSDIYSLGCLMYEALSGKPPFAGSNPIQLVVKHINDAPKPFLQQFNATVKMKGLQSVILKCLEKEQIDRWQSIDDVFDALTKIRIGRSAYSFHSSLRNSQIVKAFFPIAWFAPSVILVALVFGAVTSALSVLMPGYKLSHIPEFPLVFSAIILTSSVFYLPAYQLSKISAEGKVSKLNAWSINSLLFSGSITAGLIPSAISVLFFPKEWLDVSKTGLSFPFWEILVIVGGLVSVISMVATLVCAVGVLVDRGPRKIKIESITPRIVLISTVIVLILPFLFTKQFTWLEAEAASVLSGYPAQITCGTEKYLLGHALSKAPSDLEVLDRAVSVSNARKQYSSTIKYCDEILKLPNLEEDKVWNYGELRASALEHIGGYNGAISFYSKRIERNSEDYGGLLKLGRCHFKLKQFDKALGNFETITSLYPTDSKAYFWIAKSYMAMGRYDMAIAAIDRRMSLSNGNTTGAYLTKSYLHELIGNVSLARKELLEAKTAPIQKGYLSEYTFFIKALVCERLGQEKDALAQIKLSKVDEITSQTFDFIFGDYPDELQAELKKVLKRHGVFFRQ